MKSSNLLDSHIPFTARTNCSFLLFSLSGVQLANLTPTRVFKSPGGYIPRFVFSGTKESRNHCRTMQKRFPFCDYSTRSTPPSSADDHRDSRSRDRRVTNTRFILVRKPFSTGTGKQRNVRTIRFGGDIPRVEPCFIFIFFPF